MHSLYLISILIFIFILIIIFFIIYFYNDYQVGFILQLILHSFCIPVFMLSLCLFYVKLKGAIQIKFLIVTIIIIRTTLKETAVFLLLLFSVLFRWCHIFNYQTTDFHKAITVAINTYERQPA